MSKNALMMGSASLPGGPAPGLTIVGIDTKFGNAASVHTLTGVAANTLLVITTGANATSADATVSSSPVLTWTKRVDANLGTSPSAEIWTATFVVGGNITVTANWGAVPQTSVCYQLTGSDTIIGNGTVAQTQGVANTSVTTTRTNSIIIAHSNNWNAPDGGPGGNLTVYRGTPTQSFYYRDPLHLTAWHYYYPAVNIGAYSIGYTSPGDVDNGTSTVVLEIRSLTGSGPTPDTTDPVMGVLSSPSKTHNTINLTWTAATDDRGVTGYEVYVANSLVTTVTGLSYTLSGLIPLTAYSIKVRAKDAAGNGNDSNTISVTTNPQPIDTTPPTAPSLTLGTKTSVSINVSWSASTDNMGMANYRIYLDDNQIDTVSTATLSYQYTGLTPSTTYSLRVDAVDTSTNITPSNTITTATNPTSDTESPVFTGTPLAAPSASDIDINTVVLNWTAATDNVGVVAYDVYISPSTLHTTVTGLTATVTGLTANTGYTFFVRARDAAGNTAQTNSRTVTTDALPVGGLPLTFTYLTTDYSRYWGGAEFWGSGEAELTCTGTPPNQTCVPPYKHAYRRFTWCDFEGDTQGSYKFGVGSRFRTFLDTHINAGRRLISFGLMTNYPDLTTNNSFHDKTVVDNRVSAFPAYLMTLMANDNRPAWISTVGNHWVPNYNAPSYVTRLNALYAAIANFLNTTISPAGVLYKHAIGAIDIRGFGSWGEWHHNGTVRNNLLSTANWGDTNVPNTQYVQMFATAPAGCSPDAGTDNNLTSQGSFPSFTRVKEVIEAHKTNFPDYPLVSMLASFDANFTNCGSPYRTGWENTLYHRAIGRYLLDNDSAYGKIGWRRDQWGDGNDYYEMMGNTGGALVTGVDATNINTRWKYAPVTGEPPGYGVNGMRDLPGETDRQNPSLVGNSNYGGDSIDFFSMYDSWKKMGCILRLVNTGGTVNLTATQLIITLPWRNFGLNSQHKKNWQVWFEIRNTAGSLLWTSPIPSSFNPYLFNPGTTSTITDTYTRPVITSGTHRLHLIIKDAANYCTPLELGITGKQTDGSYILTSALNF